ncbi:MAG: FUSC family protein [Novosphingobium sp.]
MLTHFRKRLREESRSLVTPGPRMVDEVECIASVMLAIIFAHWIGARMVAWAAFTAFVLMRGHVTETLLRGLLRVLGTALGAGLALALVPYAARSLPGSVLAAAVVGAVGLYGTLTAKRSYAWLLFGLTFEMILLDKIEKPTLDTITFALSRLLEVVAGTAACVIVSLLSTLTARRRWPGKPAPVTPAIGWHPHAARHAARCGVALGLLPVVHALWGIPELQQAGITIMAVMIVPPAALGGSGLVPVSRRLAHRMLGCLAGGALAGAIVLLAQGSPPVLIAGTCLGIVIGRHIENGDVRGAYLGLQFTLAVLVTLVPDSYADAAIRPALERLTSIFVGMVVLAPFLLAWHLLARNSAPAGLTGDAPSSE